MCIYIYITMCIYRERVGGVKEIGMSYLAIEYDLPA